MTIDLGAGSVIRRRRVDGSVQAYSGATLEAVELRDGRSFVLKHLPSTGDWLTRVSGRGDRVRQLWELGVLARISAVVDHAIVDVLEWDGHDVVVMRDVGAALFDGDGPVDREASRSLLSGLAAMHGVGFGLKPEPLCGIDARYRMFAPARHAATDLPGLHPGRERILAGWRGFEEVAPPRVVAAVRAVHDGSLLLSEHLAGRPVTLLHGDAKLANLGLDARGGLVAIDWGDLTGFGPAEVDVAWFALMNEERVGLRPDDTVADYPAPLDAAAIDAACIGSLAQMGFKLLGTDRLAWWCRRVEDALDRTGIG